MTWLTSDESITRYTDALKRASEDDIVFNWFRREPGVREIVEGMPDCVGFGYHAKLKGTEFFAGNLEKIQQNDKVGGPRLFLIEGQAFTSTTLRYAWNVHDMHLNGVLLDGANVVEVGGGYGGLCRMIHAFHTPKSYTVVDLPEALALAKRYLGAYGITNVAYVSAFEYGELPVDAFISNYALTELTKNVQVGYVDKLMKRAASGYVTYNSQPRNADVQFSLAELQDSLPSSCLSKIQQENVKKSECQVLVWSPFVAV